jgi:hypothetical protein
MSCAENVGPQRLGSYLLLPLLLVALLMGIQAVSAYHTMFWMFATQDDEGHVMAPIGQVCQGKVYGDEVYCYFGPAYVFTYAGFFRLTGQPVSHDAMRLITLVLWLLVAAICWFTCHRVTRRAVVSLLVCYAAFRCAQIPFTCEPGHPQEIITLALLLVPAAAALLLPGRKGWFLCLAGLFVGYVLMCKVNVGLFAMGGLALAIVAATPGRLPGALKWALVVVAVSAPVLLMWRHLDTESGSRIATFATLAIVAALAQTLSRRSNDFTMTNWGWAGLGCLVAIVAACSSAVLSGTSLEALGGVVLFSAMKHVEVHFRMWTLTTLTLVFSAASCAASLATAFSSDRPKWQRVSLAAQWAVRLLLVVGMIAYLRPFAVSSSLYPSVLPMYEFVLPLLWIVLVPMGDSMTFRERAVRSLSVLIALFHALVVYPVSGTQVALACLLFVPCWGFAVHDTLSRLAAIVPAKTAVRLLARSATAMIVVAVLTDSACYVQRVVEIYWKQVPLGLPGAARVRLSDVQVAIYRFLTANIKQPKRTFLTLPGMYSLYFWAEKSPSTGLNAEDWMAMLSDTQQREAVESVRNDENLWAVVWPKEAADLVGFQYLKDQPLVKFILSECHRVNAVGDVQLLKHGREGGRLVQCVHWGVLADKQPSASPQQLQLMCCMPLANADSFPLAAISIVDVEQSETLACSHPPEGCEGTVALLVPTEAANQVGQATCFPPVVVDAEAEFCFTVHLNSAMNGGLPKAMVRRDDGSWASKSILVARLWGPNNELLDSVPFVADADLSEVPRPSALRFWESPQ